MKVKIEGLKQRVPEDSDVIKNFISFLQDELPLVNDIEIYFLDNKEKNMTTGIRLRNMMGILSKGRMLIDVLRTLAHEWVHEYQHQKMGLDDTQKYQDVGGPVENMSNTLSGIFVKKFEKLNPDSHSILYGMD